MAEKSYHFISVIVPAYNRADELKELLDSFSRLEYPRDQYELIIADDGSTDGTARLIEQLSDTTNLPFKYYSQPNKGPGAARNLGMENARGDFFIFVDSDVTVPADWLTNIARAINEEQADAFGGPDTFRDDFPALLKAINYSMTSFITTGGLRGRKGRKLARFYPRSFNMGLSRALWQKIGGFGSLRHGQDIEFSNRIIRSGAKVIYVADAPVFHKRRTNLRRFYRQVFNWGVARVNLFKLDPAMFEPLHAMPAVATLLVMAVVLLSLVSDFFRFLFLAGLGAAVLILIYSLYDAVRMYRQIGPALYLPLVMPAQIFGYGLGFIYNFIRRVVLGKGEKVGFKKNYYK